MLDGLRLAAGTLTAAPVPLGRVDRTSAGRAMAWAPALGAVLGAAVALPSWVAAVLGADALLCAVLAIAALAALTRGLHLDGLADTADGLGSALPAHAALGVMKASDIGPFGVVTLVLTLLLQVSALTGTWASGYGPAALVTAAATGRLGITWACRAGVPAARPDGLGHWVAGSVARPALAATTALTLAGTALLGGLGGGWSGAAHFALAVAAGLGVALLLLRHAVRRLGGITGDVLGALVEVGASAALLVLALGRV